jgi:hypothetical protein
MDDSFFRFGGFAAKTKEKEGYFPCCRRRKTPIAAQVTTRPRMSCALPDLRKGREHLALVSAAKPPEPMQEKVLPPCRRRKTSGCGRHPTPTA